MEDFNNIDNQNYYDPPVFNDLDHYAPFTGLASLFDAVGSSPTFDPLQAAASPSRIPAEPAFIEEHEIRRCIEEPEALLSPFLSPSLPQSATQSPPEYFSCDSPQPSLSFASSSPAVQLPSILEPDTPYQATGNLPFSPATVVSLDTNFNFDYASPSASSPGATVTGSPPLSIKRKLSAREECELEEFSKRLATANGPVNVVFASAPQPALESTSATATTSRLPLATRAQALCRCTFPGGNQKPARHWKTACPYNPDRQTAAFECPEPECSMTFGRKDNMLRHVRKFH